MPAAQQRCVDGTGVSPIGAQGFATAPADEDAVRTALAWACSECPPQDVPVGALVLDPTGIIIGRGTNTRERDQDPSAHAELNAIRAAAQSQGAWRLSGCTLVATLEPCMMCAGAALAARIERIVFGAWDGKAGACGSVWDLPREPSSLTQAEVVGGVLAHECADVLTDFFRWLRSQSDSR